jgi:hypothetical protein
MLAFNKSDFDLGVTPKAKSYRTVRLACLAVRLLHSFVSRSALLLNSLPPPELQFYQPLRYGMLRGFLDQRSHFLGM